MSNTFTLILVIFLLAIQLLIIHKIDEKSAPAIQQAKDLRAMADIRASIPFAYNNNLVQDKISMGKEGDDIYVAKDNHQTLAYAVRLKSDRAYNGPISICTSILLDGTLAAVHISDHNETEGIGSLIESSDWLNQFVGKKHTENQWRLSNDGGDIDAVSGATISSRAVVNALNKTLRNLPKNIEFRDEL